MPFATKQNVPISTTSPFPNSNNYSAEIAKINSLVSDPNRSNSGDIQWESTSSGEVYNTADNEYSNVPNVSGKGETGLYNLLIYKYGELNNGWILTGDNYNAITEIVDNIVSGSQSVGNALVANKLGTSTVGSANNPIYLSAGVPTVVTSIPSSTDSGYAAAIGTSSSHPAIGSASQPVYVNSSGVVTAATSYANASVGSAAKLTTARNLQTNLASTSSASFDGSGNASIGVTGTLPVSNGGTGATSVAANKIFAGSTSGNATAPSFRSLVEADIPSLSASKIGSGTLGVARGGTGASSLTTNAVILGNGTSALKAKASGKGAFYATSANAEPQFGVLPVDQGGTGQESLADVTVGSATSATTATSAGKWTTARTLSLTGDVTGSGTWDGSGNLSIATTAKSSILYGTSAPTSSQGKNGDIYIQYEAS